MSAYITNYLGLFKYQHTDRFAGPEIGNAGQTGQIYCDDIEQATDKQQRNNTAK